MGMATGVKLASDRVPTGEAVFFRAFFGLLVIVPWIASQGRLWDGIKTSNPMGHFWRGLVGVSAMSMGFASLGLLPLSEVKAIQYAQPVLVVVFAAMFLGERVRVFRLAAVVMGLAGVLIIMSPRLTTLTDGDMNVLMGLGAVLAFGSATGAALAHVFIRKLTMSEPTSAIVFWFAVTASCLSLLTVPFGWVWPTFSEAAALIGAGLCGGIGQIFLTSSYRYAAASVVAPFEYSSILLALAVGYLVFSEVPTLIMLLGIVLIVVAGITIIWRERQMSKDRAQARKAMTPQG